MPFNPSPTGYFSGIQQLSSGNAVSTSGVFLPYSDLESYNVSSSGDIRELLYSFVDAVSSKYAELATADRPTKVTINKSSFIPSNGIIRSTYNITIDLAYDNLNVAPE